MSDGQQDVGGLNFEQALAELEQIVRDLESGKAPLDKSIASYERGILLKNHCEKKLTEARMTIDRISLNADGTAGLEPFAS